MHLRLIISTFILSQKRLVSANSLTPSPSSLKPAPSYPNTTIMKLKSTLLLSTVLYLAVSLSVATALPLPGLRTLFDPISTEKHSVEGIAARGLRTSVDPLTIEKRSTRDVEARGLRTSVDPVTHKSKDVQTSGDVSAECGYRWYSNFRQCI